MQINSLHCAHCGKTFVRITEQTPLVNRSDEVCFHVTLFAGPYPRPKFSGGFHKDQVTCIFAYAHDQLGPKDHTISVVISHAEKDPDELLDKIERAADRLAGLVGEGESLAAGYTLKGWNLTPGFPT